MKKNRVLFLVQLPPPVHGVSITNEKIVTSTLLRDSNLNISVVPLRFSDAIEDIDKLNYKKVIKTVSIAGKLLHECLFFRPDTVYFSLSTIGNTFYRDILYVAILKLLRVNVVYHLHRIGVSDAGESAKIRHYLYKWVFANVWVIHLTPRLYSDIKKYVSKDRCFYVSNGIDDPVCGSREAIQDTSSGIVHFTFLSHMVVEKGVVVMLEALVELHRRGVSFTATFAGGRMSSECKRAFSDLLPAHGMEGMVRYIGPVYGKEKNELFMNTDVFVFPSLYDSFGIVLLEAMAYSLPVVSTMQGGIPDVVVEGETGYLVERNNSFSLAEKMEVLAKDQSLRLEMGRKGRVRFEDKYTADKFEENIVSVLKKCLVKPV